MGAFGGAVTSAALGLEEKHPCAESCDAPVLVSVVHIEDLAQLQTRCLRDAEAALAVAEAARETANRGDFTFLVDVVELSANRLGAAAAGGRSGVCRIATVGRTKAGKSTLRYVLTGQAENGIGIGGQRTTTSNLEYLWRDLEVVDTPGVGAFQGAEDAEVAAVAAAAADLVLWVVTSDGLQQATIRPHAERVDAESAINSLGGELGALRGCKQLDAEARTQSLAGAERVFKTDLARRLDAASRTARASLASALRLATAEEHRSKAQARLEVDVRALLQAHREALVVAEQEAVQAAVQLVRDDCQVKKARSVAVPTVTTTLERRPPQCEGGAERDERRLGRLSLSGLPVPASCAPGPPGNERHREGAWAVGRGRAEEARRQRRDRPPLRHPSSVRLDGSGTQGCRKTLAVRRPRPPNGCFHRGSGRPRGGGPVDQVG